MTNTEVIQALREGYRLDQPPQCPDTIYNDVMEKCWAELPARRLKFAEIEALMTEAHAEHAAAAAVERSMRRNTLGGGRMSLRRSVDWNPQQQQQQQQQQHHGSSGGGVQTTAVMEMGSKPLAGYVGMPAGAWSHTPAAAPLGSLLGGGRAPGGSPLVARRAVLGTTSSPLSSSTAVISGGGESGQDL